MEQGNNFVPWVEDNLSSFPGESSSLSGKDNSYLQNYLIVLVQLYHIYNMLFVSCPTSCDRYSMNEKNRINSFEDNPSELFIFFSFQKYLLHYSTDGREGAVPVEEMPRTLLQNKIHEICHIALLYDLHESVILQVYFAYFEGANN